MNETGLKELPDDFQIEHLFASLQFVKKFDCAVDIGAHRGIWTKRLVERFERVVAIEPTEYYKQIDPRARVINAACGMQAGNCRMAPGIYNTGQWHVAGAGATPVITLDSLNLRPDFIKIDVEGMEIDVLKGGLTTILIHRPLILIEENGLCMRYKHSPGVASLFLEKIGMKKLATFYMKPERDENRLFGFE